MLGAGGHLHCGQGERPGLGAQARLALGQLQLLSRSDLISLGGGALHAPQLCLPTALDQSPLLTIKLSCRLHLTE